MMTSTDEKVTFRSSTHERPLSTYDNLTNESKLNGTNESDLIERNQNVNEFPFVGISFRFDELKQLNQMPIHSPNGYGIISNNNNYKPLRNGHQHTDNTTYYNGNNVNQMRNSQGHTVTTIAQNHSSSSSTSSNSSENSYKTSSFQYANLAGSANRGATKPVHSAAKSQFLGLHKPGDSVDPNPDDHNMNGGTEPVENSEKTSTDERDHAAEMANGSDEEPLLNDYANRINAAAAKVIAATQYQNVPSNSSCYGQNQIDDANENGCTCKCSEANTEIQQYESDRYKCNGCLRASAAAAPITVVPIATMNVPTCSTQIDLSTSCASMKPTKSTTLDTSSSFRVNQPLSQVQSISCHSKPLTLNSFKSICINAIVIDPLTRIIRHYCVFGTC